MRIKKMILGACVVLSLGACGSKSSMTTVEKKLTHSKKQIDLLLTDALERGQNPRTINKKGEAHWIRNKGFDWTAGFFPGTLWYLYRWSGDEAYKAGAMTTQNFFAYNVGASSHDLGFVFNCSYGAGYKQTKEAYMLDTLISAGNTLVGRFNPKVGAILSWDVTYGWQSTRGWKFPVIIDNMMNLEMLFELTNYTGDSTYRNVAITHANTTMKNHFRDNYSSYHVIDYDPETGEVRNKHTAQGYAHESDWARGQAWGLYGYVTCYRYTKNPVYLKMAENIAKFIMNSKEIPADMIPYWDYDAPKIPDAPRDASAAAITASALIELSDYAPKGGYLDYATKVVNSLSSDAYLAKIGENHKFILMHSVGSIPHNNEIDVPLNYADYYYVEALLRLKDRGIK